MLPSSLTCAAKMCFIGGMLRASLLVGGRIGASPLLASVGMVSSKECCSSLLVSSLHFVCVRSCMSVKWVLLRWAALSTLAT